jgi:uncharacterized metal-binding protein YceD (DUF177 family)
VTLNLEKKETMMIGEFIIQGKIESSCDLCTYPVEVEVEGEYKLIFKFDDKPSDDESLIIVYPEEFELDLRENLLELITVSLPNRIVHADGYCNEEMLELLNEYRVNSDDEAEYDDSEESNDDGNDDDIDPRWAALKNLGDTKEK